ncbi:SPFH domain-containing protein [Acaryochloris sp. CCMEE 5410]|uniref:SPFH domain-containing protein n=1 Tax=Acaryochloris sp. CCMEE 5410 TaxID=310037 RepID=UPI000301538A|nr:SPFH domain-containing protein [Acaryochloris sp. CCMEE 5410]
MAISMCSLGLWQSLRVYANVPSSKISPEETNLEKQPFDYWKLGRQIVLVFGVIGTVWFAIVFFQKGCVVIGEDEVGIKYKKFSLNPFQPKSSRRQLISRNKEPGYQPDTIDSGWTWLFPGMYTIYKEPVVEVPPGEIALVFAHDGEDIPNERILAKYVKCNSFQDGDIFLQKGGEKGRQLGILTGGTSYRINTKLFTVITRSNLADHDSTLKPEDLLVYKIDSDKIGIVTTSDGAPLETGEIAGPTISGHDNFQSPQKFIDGGGNKGLQEDVLSSGPWNLNPWFVKVEQVPLTEIREGTVGVVVSLIGEGKMGRSIENSSSELSLFTNRYDLVDRGKRGVWKEPLDVGSYPINTKVRRIVLVPTHQITLDWSNDESKPDENYDKSLGTLTLRLKDRIPVDIVVRQRFRVPKENAPLMVSQIGSPGDITTNSIITDYSATVQKYKSIRDLIVRVLEPTVRSYFYNAVQDCEAEDFYIHRSDQQKDAAQYLKGVLREHGVEAIDTLIGEIDLPDVFDNLEIKRKLEEKKRNLIEQEILTEDLKRKLAYLKAVTGKQEELVNSQMSLEFAEREAQVKLQKALADAKAMREQGRAQADVELALRQAISDALGQRAYIEIEKLKEISKFKLPPIVGGNEGSGAGLLIDTLLASVMENLTSGNSEAISGSIIEQVAALFSIDLNEPESKQLKSSSDIQVVNSETTASLSEDTSVVCNSCGTLNPPNHKFCFECSSPLVYSSDSKK